MNSRTRRLKRYVAIVTLGPIAAVLCAALLLELVAAEMPFPAEDLRPPKDSTRLLDRKGGQLREVVNGQGARSRWVPLSKISPLIVAATLAVEDTRFFRHRGIDDVGVVRALWDNLTQGAIVSGASTITMQTARLIHPHARRRSLEGKLREAMEARRLERALSKAEILEQYLNRAYYGVGLVGVEAASRRYFGKAAGDLGWAEAALLAGLPKAPSLLDPRRSPRRAKQRRDHVLWRLNTLGWLSADATREAWSAPITLAEAPPLVHPALHATDWALSQLRRRGHRGGAVATTLDGGLSRHLGGMIRDHLEGVAGAGATQAAVVVLDHGRCEVRAMVGSADYFGSSAGAVNGALALRQPGSTLKPFTYALAFERGASPASVVADIETRYTGKEGSFFAPRNFDGTFSGPVLMADALGRSLNVPAVRLAEALGLELLLERLQQLGFRSLDHPAAHYGLGLTLGSGEVTLLELAQGYAALARGGRTCKARVLAPNTRTPAPPEAQVFSPQVAYLTAQALARQQPRIEAFGVSNALMFDYPVSVKTGTSSDFRDNWALGFAGPYTVGVWVGNFEGGSLGGLSGAHGAGPLFARVMERLLGKRGPRPAPPPPGVAEVTVCATSGRLPGPTCPRHRTLFVDTATSPRTTCPWHRKVALDTRNGLRAGPRCPERFVVERPFTILPQPYAPWSARHPVSRPPSRYSPLCPASGLTPGAVAITHPSPGDVFVLEPGYPRGTQSLELRAQTAAPPAGRVSWRIDGELIARRAFPYTTHWPLTRGRHVLVASAPGRKPHRVVFEVR